MRLARWGLVLGMVPVVFATTMVVPERVGVLGVGPALGCGAGGNVPQPEGFRVLVPALRPDNERDAVPVGTDGFFVIVVGTSGLDAEATLSAMTIDVRSATGEVLSGQTWLLKEEAPGSYLFGWEADEHLELGAELTLTLDGAPWAEGSGNVGGGEFPLVVAGEPVALPRPALAASPLGFFRGAGSNIGCAIDPDYYPCEEIAEIEVPDTLEELQAIEASWQLPEVSVGVAWEARLEASVNDSDAETPEYGSLFLADGPGPPEYLGVVKFPTSAEEHCVMLAIRDLRFDVLDSEEFCFASEPPARFETDTELLACLEPPNEATSEAWCRLKGEEAPPECEAIFDGAGGSAAEPGAGGNDDGAARGSRTSKGCQLGGAASGSAGAWLALAALVALRRRR